jgi:hypothetical protein
MNPQVDIEYRDGSSLPLETGWNSRRELARVKTAPGILPTKTRP